MLQDFSKVYCDLEDGFDGSIEGYLVSTQKENLKIWLEKEISNSSLYDIIRQVTPHILIIKNLWIDEVFRGKGFGSKMISDILKDSDASAAILVCDISQSQKPGFILEKFYQSQGFQTIFDYLDYPLMFYPKNLAEKIDSFQKKNS